MLSWVPDLPPVETKAAIWLLPLVAPIAIWVAWSDLRSMTIPNRAVLALCAVWLAFGWVMGGAGVWAWGLGLIVAAFVIAFLISLLGLIGAGDLKFAAAMSPFFLGADARLIYILLASCLIGAFVTHRIVRAIPAVRRTTPDWVSWTHRQFPFGFALGGMLVIYLVVAHFLP